MARTNIMPTLNISKTLPNSGKTLMLEFRLLVELSVGLLRQGAKSVL